MKLSIVLTVYNKEPFLRRAFNALLMQENVTVSEYEVLVVNDGSTDGSIVIIDEYVRHDTRVRVLTQENQGLSVARNNGVKEALGEYVWFVDADDIVSSFAVSSICNAMTTMPDLIIFHAKTEGEDRIRNKIIPIANTGKKILEQGLWEPCAVFSVANRDFLIKNNLRFLPGIYHEDDEYTPRLLYAAQSLMVIPEVLYTVIHEPNSITGVPRVKRAYDYLIVSESLGRFVEQKREEKTDTGKAIYNHAALCINNGLHVISLNKKEDQRLFNLYFSERKQRLIRILMSSADSKYKIEGILFKLFCKNYVFIYKVLQLIKKIK